MSLTVCQITSRDHPMEEWVWQSIGLFGTISQNAVPGYPNAVHAVHRKYPELEVDFMSISLNPTLQVLNPQYYGFNKSSTHKPKPNVWQGEHKISKSNHWAKCNSINTALCLCNTDWILFLDDRCVLAPGFMDAVIDAMRQEYIMAGAYEKRVGMKVDDGVIVEPGKVIGEDSRLRQPAHHAPNRCPGAWLFGCVVLVKLEWALSINGWPEILCDSMSMEDVIAGMIFTNAGHIIKYDPRAKIIEDRTPEFLGETMKRTSKERWPNDTSDKAHTALQKARTMKRSENPFGEIRELRDKVQRGEAFPVLNQPTHDWFDGQPLSEM